MCPPKKRWDSNSLNSVNFNYLQFIVSQLDIIWPSGIVNQTLTPPKKWVIWRWFITTFLEYASESNQATDEGKDLKLLFFLIKQKTPGPMTTGPSTRWTSIDEDQFRSCLFEPEGWQIGGNLSKICFFHPENWGDLLICRAYCSIVWGRNSN